MCCPCLLAGCIVLLPFFLAGFVVESSSVFYWLVFFFSVYWLVVLLYPPASSVGFFGCTSFAHLPVLWLCLPQFFTGWFFFSLFNGWLCGCILLLLLVVCVVVLYLFTVEFCGSVFLSFLQDGCLVLTSPVYWLAVWLYLPSFTGGLCCCNSFFYCQFLWLCSSSVLYCLGLSFSVGWFYLPAVTGMLRGCTSSGYWLLVWLCLPLSA
jgi:hypothetical protein